MATEISGINNSAFTQALDQIKEAGKPGQSSSVAQTDGLDFGAAVEAHARKAVDIAKTAEMNNMKAINGEVDLPELVQSVTNAETTLRTVVAIRDRLVQAYQEIIKMPV